MPVTDLTLDDTLSIVAGVAPQSGSGYTCGTATADGGTGFTEASCVTSGSPTTQWDIEWFFDEIASGETVTITMPIYAPVDEANGLVYDNTVSTTVKEYYDVFLDDPGKITVINPSPPQTPTKVADPNPATVNDIVEYTVSWVAQPTMIFADLAYYDTLPDGLTFIDYGEVTCTGQCPTGYSVDDIAELTPVPNADGTTTLMWWFGDMPGSQAGATWSMTYTARVDDTFNDGTTSIVDGDSVDNEVIGYSNEEGLLDEPTVIPDPSIWTTYPPSPPVTETLDIREPELAIAKSATPSSDPTDASSTITYSVEVSNTGVMNAYGVVVEDTPNGALEDIVLDPTTYPGSVPTRGWTSIDPTLGWFIPTLKPGDTAVFTYTAEVIDDFLTAGYPAAENLASIEEYRARPGLEPEPGDRIYNPDATAETSVPLVGPEIQLDKYVGGCSDDFAFVEEGTDVTWCVVVTNIGAAPAYQAVVRDTLPFKWDYIGPTNADGWTAAEPTIGSLEDDVATLEWAVGDIAPGETIELSFATRPQAGSPLNVTNWAAVESFQSNGDPLPVAVAGARDDDPASAALGQFALEIAKLPDRQSFGMIDAGGQVTWELVISNPSTTSENTNLVVTDFLPAPLTYDSWASTDPRVSLTSAGATGAGPGGTTEIEWAITDLDAGESLTITITADVPGATVVEGQWYVNDVQVTSDQVADLVANQAKVEFYEPASLGDFTWIDDDGDGVQDPTDTPVDGVVVNLLDGAGNQLYRDPATGLITTDAGAGFPAMTTTTGDDPSTPATEVGWYEFGDLPAGSYTVEFVPPAGMQLTWDDQGSSAVGDAGDAADSDADRTTGRSHVVTLDPGEHDPTIDAGFLADAVNSLGDFTWLDADGDGVQDPTELPLEGVIVTLYGPGPDGVFGGPDDVALATTTTDAAGFYEFTNLPDGEYVVGFELDPTNPAHDDLVATFADQGSDAVGDAGDADDSDADRLTGLSHVIDLDAAGIESDPVIDPTIDAGYIVNDENELGDFTWIDADMDGVQDPTEAVLPGVLVDLIGAGPDGVFGTADDVVLQSTVTDGSGFYEFTDLPDGEYQVEFALDPTNPAHDGLAPTWADQGLDDADDSDADRVTGRSHTVDLDAAGAESDPVVDPTIDAGFFPADLNEIGDFTWLDADRDGVQDPTELPLEGVIVTLYGPGPDGVFGGADDVVLQSVTTDAAGFYEFTNLPDGEYVVGFELDPTNPAHDGLDFTFSDQGGDDAADSDADRLTGLSHVIDLDAAGVESDPVVDPTIDAGFFSGGDNSLGDYTWIDADMDGVQDPTEAVLPGVLVDLIGAGPDGVFGTADDVVLQSTTTDATGFYEFTDLPDGEYQVEFALDPANPAHDDLVPTWEHQGSDAIGDAADAEDSDANRQSGRSHTVDLDSAGVDPDPVDDPTIDAGWFDGTDAVNSLGDFTWLDADGDGVQDPTELPLEGVIVTLYGPGPDGVFGGPDDVALATTTTDAAGFYEFTNLPDGEYVVGFELDPTNPAHDGLDFTFSDQGGDDAADSDADRLTGLSHVIDLDAAGVESDPVVDPTIDAGFFSGGDNSLGDYTWIDADMDGVQDPTEAVLPGVLVDLIGAGPDGVFGTADDVVLQSTVTDGSGFYEFTDLPDGEYQVEFALDPTNPAHDGLAPTFADQGGDDAVDSDADRVTGRTDTVDLDAAGAESDPVVDPTIDAGFFTSDGNSLGDHTWLDADGDGVQDPDELPLEGVIVTLYGPGPDGVFGGGDDVVLQTTTTDGDGFYEFTDLPDGEYVVGFELDPTNPAHDDLAPTWADQGDDDAADSDADRVTGLSAVVDLDSAGAESDPVHDPTIDAGFLPDAVNSLGDVAWLDANQDGVQDPTETPLDGVVVQLMDAGPDGVYGTADDIVLQTTTTGDDPSTPAVEQGWYEFSGLPDGQYQVIFALDADEPTHDGLVPTWEFQGADTAEDSNANRQNGATNVIDLDSAGVDADGIHDPTIDAGFFSDPSAVNSVGDFVWLDADGDGVQDAGEAPVEGIVVRLIDPATGAVLATTLTDENGFYEFTNLPDGSYQIQFETDTFNPDHGGLVLTAEDAGGDDAADSDADRNTGLTHVFDLDPDGLSDDPVHDPTIDAGYILDAGAVNEIGDTVWLDLDADGVQDAGEPGIEGVIVELIDLGDDGILGTADDLVIATETTDSNGNYSFTDLPDGSYVVEFTLDPTNPAHDDLVPTLEDQQSDTVGDAGDADDSDMNRQTGQTHVIELDPNSESDDPVIDPTIDAGFISDPGAVNEIGDTVWIDVDGDGVQDTDEPGLGGVVVNLIDPATGTQIATTVTDGNGNYEFTNLPDGTYQVEFELPAGHEFTTQDTGSDATGDSGDAADSDADPTTGLTHVIELDPDGLSDDPVIDPTIDAGVYEPASLGDTVWFDTDRDGIQDPGEPGIEGVEVTLYLPGPDGEFGTDDDVEVATTTTDENGEYGFDGLTPDDYGVWFDWSTLPDGMLPSPADAGDDDAADSDADPATGWSDTVTLSSGEHDPTIDAGAFEEQIDLVITKSVGDTVDAGAALEWVITVRNDGLDRENDPFTVIDQLAPGLTYRSHTGDGWDCTIDGQLVECIWDAGLDVNEVTTELIIVTDVAGRGVDEVTNEAVVQRINKELVLSNNTASETATIQTVPDLLAFTGGDANRVVQVALLLLTLGAGFLLLAGRRRRTIEVEV